MASTWTTPFLTLALGSVALLHSVIGHQYNRVRDFSTSPLTDDCLRCLCAASSDCKSNARCRIIEPDKYLCGPFRLNENYWRTAGEPSLSKLWQGKPLDFEMCALNLECSIKSVSNLMKIFIKKCNVFQPQTNQKEFCRIAALVHYQAVYANSDYDYYDEDSTRSALQSHSDISPMIKCNVNSTNIDDHILNLFQNAPATRSDEMYWPRFEECTKNRVIATS